MNQLKINHSWYCNFTNNFMYVIQDWIDGVSLSALYKTIGVTHPTIGYNCQLSLFYEPHP